MSTPTYDKMREAFESFALARNCPPSALLPLEDGTYKQDGTLAGMWAAWQAATLAAQSEIDRLNTQRRELQTDRIDLLERLARADVDAQRMVLAERERCVLTECRAMNYATTLAKTLHAKHYPQVTQWKPLPDLLGVLTQIDNMTAGLVGPNE
jgi:hypothetical protein